MEYTSSDPTSNGVESAIKKMNWEEPEMYRVEWSSSEKWDFDSAYAVQEFRFGEGAKAQMLLIGPRGGEYLIDSNPTGRPKVIQLRSDGYESEDRLAEIKIFSEDFNWRHRVLRAIEGATDKIPERS